MEEHLLSKFQITGNNQEAQIPALSLITNPSTSHLTLSSLLKTLTSQNPNPNLLPLLSSLAHHHHHLHHQISTTVRTFYLNSSSLINALSLLFSINHNISDITNESLFLSLCFQPYKPSIRQWLLKNSYKFTIRPSVLLTVLLGFTKDPYPYTRIAALDGSVMLSHVIIIEDQTLVQACYFRAVQLLFDSDHSVRCSAIRAVSKWGDLLKDWSDALFVQICSMVRDMSMKVRLEAFEALGRIKMVSEDILLRTLSKKTKADTKEIYLPGKYTVNKLELPVSTVAFAFVHGLEDEFYEVRRCACYAMRTPMILYEKFANEAIDLLMYLYNDDSIVVRLELLETMYYMAMSDHLNLKEPHIHMLLSMLGDNDTLIRCSVRRILCSIKLCKLSLFKSCINGVIKNLEMYPQDEAGVFCVLFKIGQKHGKYVISLMKEVSEEIEPSFGGKFGVGDVKTVALLVLAISAPVSYERCMCTISPSIYSYAVIILGRISHGLAEIMTQNTLFDFLTQCSRFTLDEEGKCDMLLLQSEKESVDDEVKLHCVNVILPKVKDMWPLIRGGYTDEVILTLRSLKEEVDMFRCKSVGIVVFTLNYLHVIELLGKLWSQLKLSFNGLGELEILLRDLDKCLTDMRYGFIGLSKEEQFYILELVVVTYTLRLCINNEVSCIKNLNYTISCMENMGSCEVSNFVIEVKKGVLENPFMLRKVLECFSLREFVPCQELKHKEARIVVEKNDNQNGIPFIGGFPVEIPLEIVVYNVSNEDKLWVRMRLEDELTQFVFIDLGEDGIDCGEVRKLKFGAPFYMPPRAKYFSLSVCVVMECLFEDCYVNKDLYGPKHKVACLCDEKQVYFSMLVSH